MTVFSTLSPKKQSLKNERRYRADVITQKLWRAYNTDDGWVRLPQKDSTPSETPKLRAVGAGSTPQAMFLKITIDANALLDLPQTDLFLYHGRFNLLLHECLESERAAFTDYVTRKYAPRPGSVFARKKSDGNWYKADNASSELASIAIKIYELTI